MIFRNDYIFKFISIVRHKTKYSPIQKSVDVKAAHIRNGIIVPRKAKLITVANADVVETLHPVDVGRVVDGGRISVDDPSNRVRARGACVL